MQTLETGSYSKQLQRGFTLIELLMVLFIVLLMATILLPRSFNLKGGRLEREVRHMVAFVSHLSAEAALKKRPLRLYYDLDNGRYWAVMLDDNRGLFEEKPFETPLLRTVHFPEGITFHEVAVRSRLKTNKGITYTSFTPWGYRDRTMVYLKTEEDKIITIAIPSIGERVKVYEGYRE